MTNSLRNRMKDVPDRLRVDDECECAKNDGHGEHHGLPSRCLRTIADHDGAIRSSEQPTRQPSVLPAGDQPGNLFGAQTREIVDTLLAASAHPHQVRTNQTPPVVAARPPSPNHQRHTPSRRARTRPRRPRLRDLALQSRDGDVVVQTHACRTSKRLKLAFENGLPLRQRLLLRAIRHLDGTRVPALPWSARIQNVASRAVFDLNCPRDRLGLAPLQYDGDLITSYAVVGCGKRAVYVRGARNTFTLDPGPIQGQPVPPAR